MANFSHVCALSKICKHCRKTYSDDHSSITRFSYEFDLLAIDSGFVGASPLFSTSHAQAAKLDWVLELGPDFGLTLHLRGWEGRDYVNVHVICCWKLPFMQGDFKLDMAINENLYPDQQLPAFWRSKLPDSHLDSPPNYAIQCSQHNCSVLLNITLQHQNRRKHVEHLGRFLPSTLKNGHFSDVTLETQGKTFRAHKLILWQRWPALKQLNNDKNHIILNDMKPRVLKMVLGYLYSGKLENVNDSQLRALQKAANKWRLDDLKKLCQDLMEEGQDDDASKNLVASVY